MLFIEPYLNTPRRKRAHRKQLFCLAALPVVQIAASAGREQVAQSRPLTFQRALDDAAAGLKLAPEDVAQVVVDLLNHPARSLPSRVEIRPARPPRKG